jgi:DNA modification methylase
MNDVQLRLGDCLEFLKTLEPGAVDAVVTDPPYGMGLAARSSGGRKGRRLSADQYTVIGDDSQERGLHAAQWAKDHRLPVAMFASPEHPWPGDWGQLLVWDKGPAVGGGGALGRTWKKTFEFIQVAGVARLNGARDSAVLRYWITPQLFAEHPNAKPVDLMAYLVKKLTQPGDTILDPFMGSGTTGVACVRTGRKFIGCELDPTYFAIAERRIAAEREKTALFA